IILLIVAAFSRRRPRGGGAASHGQTPGPTTHGQAGCSQGPLQGGSRPRPKPLARAAASMHCCPRAWLALEGAVPMGIGSASSQAARGSSAARATACNGGRSRKVAPPTREVPPEGSSACCKGGCPR
ncbi:hypothetical protein B296_00049157, partial [Ensete ventricosum]